MIVVTGGTGHIGNVLVRRLIEQGKEVKIFTLPSESLKSVKGLDVEIVKGDVRDIDSLISAFEGAEVVYHLAGIISILPDKNGLLYDVNVNGTRNVVNACIKTGVKRLIYTSSVHALKEPPKGTIIDENCKFEPQHSRGGYDETKALASLEVLKGIKKGLEAVIVCPSGIIGPYDYHISQMGTLFIYYMNGSMKAYLDGAYDFVDVRDVAEGLILACEHGKSGETYILSGERIKVPELMKYLEKITGVKAPSFKAPFWLLKVSCKLTPLYYRFTKDKPLFTSYSIEVLNSNSEISYNKARNELGFSPRPVKESIKDSVEWFKENNYV